MVKSYHSSAASWFLLQLFQLRLYQCCLAFFRMKVMSVVLDLLIANPEQEQELLSRLVKKPLLNFLNATILWSG